MHVFVIPSIVLSMLLCKISNFWYHSGIQCQKHLQTHTQNHINKIIICICLCSLNNKQIYRNKEVACKNSHLQKTTTFFEKNQKVHCTLFTTDTQITTAHGPDTGFHDTPSCSWFESWPMEVRFLKWKLKSCYVLWFNIKL